MTGLLKKEYFNEIKKVYLVEEPDDGGKAFVKGLWENGKVRSLTKFRCITVIVS